MHIKSKDFRPWYLIGLQDESERITNGIIEK